ncbi:MAG: metal ABC transporter substrate-binding protein [Candidatus Zixiibacteriota bacterium]
MFTKALILLGLILVPLSAGARVKVVSSTSDLAYFATVIAGGHVDITTIASPKRDPHFVEVRPSFMMKMSRADVALKVGLGLDRWLDGIIDGSRNSDIVIVDCSKYIKPLEVPSFKADARYGDLHQQGNPHYWLGPDFVPSILRAITEGLAAVDPERAAEFDANRRNFLAEFDSSLTELTERAAVLRGEEIIFYHNSWPYLSEFTGLNVLGFVEQFPGVPPSPSHIKKLSELVLKRGVKVIAIAVYFDTRVPEKIAAATGARVVTLYPSLGAREKNESYLDFLDANLSLLKEAFDE